MIKLDYAFAGDMAVQFQAGTVSFRNTNAFPDGTAFWTGGIGLRYRLLNDHEGYLVHLGGNELHAGNLFGNLWIDVNGTLAEVGGAKFGVDVGVGAELSLIDYVQVGPFVRLAQYGTTTLASAGLSFSFGFPSEVKHTPAPTEEEEAPPPTPEPPPAPPAEPAPSPDWDGDAIPDALDRCPDQPENYNRNADTDGCPDEVPDGDKDGIPDTLDKCPKQAGSTTASRTRTAAPSRRRRTFVRKKQKIVRYLDKIGHFEHGHRPGAQAESRSRWSTRSRRTLMEQVPADPASMRDRGARRRARGRRRTTWS